VDRIHPSDTLYIYDGTGTGGLLLAKVTGNPSSTNRMDYFFGGGAADETFLSLSPCITFVFVSDGALNDDGWEAAISCVPALNCGGNPPASDLFLGAPYICNLDGYCGRTSGTFDEDFPCNLTDAGGSCPGPLFGGTIENNSWLQFQATSATASFDFNVTGCAMGIQAAIFEYTGSANLNCNFTRLSDCALSDGGHLGNFTLTASGMTPGNTYYLMVDGNTGDVCDYTINVASSGVAIVNAGADQAICAGNSANLTATGPSGATYTWTWDNGSGGPVTGANQTFSPSATTTYVVEITGGGLCVNETDTVVVTVNPCGCTISAMAAGSQTACNPGNNTYTQQVTVTYANPPASGNLLVNGQSFPITASPQTVTLTNLTANGNPVNVTASFSADPGCTFTSNGLFTAPAACSGCAANAGTISQ
jgi:hypothetical protein